MGCRMQTGGVIRLWDEMGKGGGPWRAYRGDGNGSKSEWIAYYVTDVDASTAVLPVVLHFA